MMVRNPITGDPAIKLALDEREKFIAAGGDPNEPGAQEAWIAERRKEDAEEAAEYERLVSEEREQRRAESLKRQQLLSNRERNKFVRPQNYTAPNDLNEVSKRVDQGEAYFENFNIDGDGQKVSLDFAHCNFRNSTFRNVEFDENASLELADFSGCDFEKVSFLNSCNVRHANFDLAKFSRSTFEDDCLLFGASFKGSSFSKDCSIEFDQNLILHATFAMPKNRWQRLLSSYTGVQQFLNLAFSLLYLILLTAKIFALATLAELQLLAFKVNGSDTVIDIEKGLAEAQPVWKIAFGGASPTIISIALAFLILIYQGARYFVTKQISPLIEDQKIDGRTPARTSYENLRGYDWLVWVLGWVVFLLFLVDLYFALFAQLYPVYPIELSI